MMKTVNWARRRRWGREEVAFGIWLVDELVGKKGDKEKV